MAPSQSTAPHPVCLHRIQWGTLLQAWGCCLVTKSHYQLHLMTYLLLQHCLCRGWCTGHASGHAKRWAWVCDAYLSYELAFCSF